MLRATRRHRSARPVPAPSTSPGRTGCHGCPAHRSCATGSCCCPAVCRSRRPASCQNLGPLVAGLDTDVFETCSQREEFTERIPAQVVFLDELVNVLGCRTARSRFVHSAAGHQRHDRQHLGAGAELQDREQVGEVVAQDVSGRGDGVQPAHRAFQRVPHRPYLRHDLDIETLGVVVGQVGVDLLAQFVLVRALRVQPEHHRHARIPCPGDGQLDPVADRGVPDDGHAPDVAGLPRSASAALRRCRGRRCWRQPSSGISNVLSCEPYSSACCAIRPDVGDGAHRRRIELARASYRS